jgi:hypothetical protein
MGDKNKKKTKTMVDSEGNLRTVETNKEMDEADKARDAAYEKYFKDKPVKKKAGGMLKKPDNPGLSKLPIDVRNKMGYMKKGGKVGYKKGGKVSSCSKRADGCAVKGKTKGRMV